MQRRYHTLITNLPTLILTAALVIGVPVALVTLVGWPLPTILPNIDAIQLALRSGIDPTLLINTLAVIAWVAWAQLVVALGIEATAATKGRTARRIPVMPGVQPFAAQLVATVALVAASFAPLRPPLATAASLTPSSAEPTTNTLVLDPPGLIEGDPITVPAPTRPATEELATYEVKHFDTLWKIAETTLGDGTRWNEIRDLNIGKPTTDGELIIATTEHVPAGTTLILPADAAFPTPRLDHPANGGGSAANVEAPSVEMVVERGDNFWRIAEETLQDAWGRQPTSKEIATYWQTVIDINRTRLLAPYDPKLIYPSQALTLPNPPVDHEATAAPPTETEAASGSTEIVVERGDNFWRIAEEALQDAWGRQPTSEETANYWQQVIDANRDRLLPPHDPNFIYPWQVLELPTPPADVAAATTPGAAPETVHDVDAPAPNMRDPGIEIPPDLIDVHGAAAPSDVDGSDNKVAADELESGRPAASDETDTETPLDIDDVTGAAGSAITETQPPAVTPTTTAPLDPTRPSGDFSHGTVASEEEAPPDDSDQDRNTMLPVGTAIAGLGILAAGLVALLSRLRRRQLRQRQPGTAPTPPPPTATKVESTLRAAAAPDATQLIDLALRAMAHDIGNTQQRPPQLVGVNLEPGTLRVLLWAPHHDPPPGWEVDDDGRSWTLPTDIDPTRLHFLADTTPAPYPGLVTVGHGDDTQLLLNLAFLGAVQVTGDPTDVAATCYTLATELAASPFADTLQVVCVGFGDDLANLERIRVVDKLSDAADLIDRTASTDQSLWPHTPPLDPGWRFDDANRPDMVVVVDPHPTPPDGADRLLGAALAGHGVAAVVGYPTGDRWRFHVTDGSVRIDPLGYTLNRRNLTRSEQAAVGDLITAAKDLDGVPEAEYEESAPAVPIGITSALDEMEVEATTTALPVDTEVIDTVAGEASLEVKVLGTLRVAGLDERFPQQKCEEIVTYLALHRHGSEPDTVMEALWPEQPPNRQRLATIVSRARATLGKSPDGGDYLPTKPRGDLYQVSPRLGCDLERFTRHVQAAAKASPADAQQRLRAALELVEGRPFNGIGNAYGWAHTEGIITHAIVAVDNAAHRLAELALDANDTDLAMWAARQGLTATGVCEACYRNLMRCAIAEDNQTALDATLEELTAVMDADDGPDAVTYLEHDTIELYEQHRRNRRSHAE